MRIELPEKMRRLFSGPARYRIAYGGRGGGRSWGFCRMAIVRALSKKTLVLCTREHQISIKDSVHKLIKNQIEMLGVSDYFKITDKTISVPHNGSEFIFKGLWNNEQGIRSTEGIDVCWIEEGQAVSKSSLNSLIPTVRGEGSEIWIGFNPIFEDDPVMELVKSDADGVRSVMLNWRDNPWFPSVLDDERRLMQKTDPELYQHVWEGECRQISDAQILKGKYRIASFHTPVKADGPYYGIDWGFANDPTALVKCWIKANTLYVEYEVGGTHIDLDDLPKVIDTVPDSKRHTIRADSARPETIAYVQKKGYNVVAAEKWAGSVEDGINYLRSFDEIVIHERCVNTAKEARLYSYKTDKRTEDVLPIVLDANNHYIDAIRYALQPIIKASTQGGFRVL